jgi:hypothetical protein
LPSRGAVKGYRVSLIDLNLPIDRARLPGDVRSFLREADRRIRRFRHESRIPGFVPSDFENVYEVLRTLTATDLTWGNLFCEWGSGFGVASCLAAMLGFDACGIEIEGELVDAARQLADDFDLPVEFVRGSFIPNGREVPLATGGEFAWLTTQGADTHEELGLDPHDFGVIYAYPWPDEERLTGELFERYAGAGAVLMTYHGSEDCRLRQKISDEERDR